MKDWDDIRYFLEVARNRNVTVSARNLGVNHSTVSRRIQRLEEKHGVRLFDRIPSGYKMTPAAEAIYEIAEEIEAKNQQVTRQLFGQDQRLAGDINLTMAQDIFQYFLLDDIAEFGRMHPQIMINLHTSKTLRNMAEREADIAVRPSPSPPDYLIGKEACRVQHGIYGCTQEFDNDDIPLVVWDIELQVPNWAQEHFKKSHIAMRVNDLNGMYAAVRGGIGVARMPCFLPDVIADPSVKRFAIDLPKSDWGLWVLSHADLRDTNRIRHCRQFLFDRLIRRKSLFEGKDSIFFATKSYF